MAVRCGIVGAGHWARSALVPALRSLPDLQIVGCVAGSSEEARRFADAEGIARHYATLDSMLADQDGLSLIVVATPDHVHAPAVEAALGSGVAVYCEKPLANDAPTARKLASLGDATAVPATVGYSFRFNPAVQALKRDIRKGLLGDPWLIELAEHNPQFHPHSGKSMNWKGDPTQAGGGALFEYGSHVVDMGAWLLGPIERVSTRLKRVLPGARLDDIATMQMSFESSAAGLLVASWVLSGGFPGIRIRLHGSEAIGEVWVDDRIEGGQRYHLSPAFQPGGFDQTLEPLGEFRSDAAARHLADFAAVVGGRSPRHEQTLPSLSEGAHVQDVLEAALQATDEWRWVGNDRPRSQAQTREEVR